MVFIGLLNNITLLVSMVIVHGLIMRRWKQDTITYQLLSGLLFGGVVVIGMIIAVEVMPGIIFDGRSILLAVAGLFGGPVTAVTAAVIGAAYRIWIGGAGAFVGVSVIIESACFGIAYHYLRRRYFLSSSPLYLLAFGLLVHVTMLALMMLLPGGVSTEILRQIALPVLVLFPLATVLVCMLFLDQEYRFHAGLKLRESEEKYRELVEYANSIILLWNVDGTINFFNDFGRTFFGYTSEEILGRNIMDTIVPGTESTGRDLKAMIDNITAHPEEYVNNLNENIRSNGERVWISWTNRPVYDREGRLIEILSIGNDLTERRKVEAALQESEHRFREFFENMSSCAAIYEAVDEGEDFIFQDFNKAGESAEGIKREDIIGRRVTEVFPGIREFGLFEVFQRVWRTGNPERFPASLYLDDRIVGWRDNYVLRLPSGEVVAIYDDVTKRKQMEKALLESEEKFRTVFDEASDGILIADPVTKKFVEGNKAICSMLGYAKEEIEELTIHDIHPPEALPHVLDEFEKQFKKEKVLAEEIPVLRKDGAIFYADVGSYPLSFGGINYLVGIFRDITDRKRAEEKIREYSENLEQMVEERTEELNHALFDSQEARDRIDGILKSVADGLIVTDLYNRVILMNRAAEDLLGVRLSDVIDRSIDYAINDATLRERIRTTLEKREPGYQFDFELPGENNAHPRIMRARTSVIEDIERRHIGIITIIQDVTYEREVDRMKTEFLSTAAHELRTPLTSIRGFSELLMTRDDITYGERTRFLSYINSQSTVLATIIDDLLDISRIESGKGFELKKIPTDIEKLVRDVTSRFEAVSSVHRFDITFPEQPDTLTVDPDKMEQVFTNIFSNAVKYSPGGGIITVEGSVTGDVFQISVTDKGIGMTPEQVERIFDKFYRADSSDTAIPGTGLGMSIVKYIVEAHGGTVWVESEPGKETTVYFTIP